MGTRVSPSLGPELGESLLTRAAPWYSNVSPCAVYCWPFSDTSTAATCPCIAAGATHEITPSTGAKLAATVWPPNEHL